MREVFFLTLHVSFDLDMSSRSSQCLRFCSSRQAALDPLHAKLPHADHSLRPEVSPEMQSLELFSAEQSFVLSPYVLFSVVRSWWS